MYKVAYNTTYGGFDLPDKAKEELQEKYGWSLRKIYDAEDPYGGLRHHPELIAVIESLPEEVRNTYSISILVIDCPRYRIHEYDGAETVITQDEEEYIDINANYMEEK